MGIWYFWEQYNQTLDNLPEREVQTKHPPADQLDRETVQKTISRFLSAVKRMPKAWGSKPWTVKQMTQSQNNVANDLFRKRLKRELAGRQTNT